MRATQSGHVEVARAVLQAAGACDQPGPNNATPLYCAASEGHLELVHLLLDARACCGVAEAQHGAWTAGKLLLFLAT